MQALRSYLPRGGGLPEATWQVRHRVVCAVLALHLVILVGYGLLATHPDGPASAGTGIVAVALGLALTTPLNRRARTLAATLGLLSCSAVLVQLSHGSAVMHVHYVLAVAVTALYEDWTTYLAAIAFVVLGHLLVAGIDPGGAIADDRDPLRSTLVDLVFVLGTSVTQLVFWSYADQARLRDSLYRTELAELSEGRSTVQARIRQLETTREDLLATVSHEFRTPLTAIQGAAMTMRKHRTRLPEARLDEMLDAVVANTERLGRLLENMLTAAEARAPDRKAVTDVHRVATEVAELVEAAHVRRAPSVVVAVDEGLEARVEGSALHQILANLLDNAIIHAQPGSHAIISGAVEEGDVVVTVANEAEGVDAEMLAELFEPFTQRDSSSTRAQEGAGVGLYVVRRLVEVSLGSLSVRSQPGWVSVEVRLPRAPEEPVDLNADERYAGR
ncbi:MAG: two-component system, OmpR family, sensor kinase [Frankiales bacterium]|jgi:signal transduction histidine kinase|nr:two-component system, OmpR family, sensor kinase [Frankiales bacterium]